MFLVHARRVVDVSIHLAHVVKVAMRHAFLCLELPPFIQ
jgi:hypothetical protein